MRKLILVAGFALVSAAAHAGDRSLSLGGSETTTVTAPAKVIADTGKTAQAAEVPTAEVPKYVERPAAIEPKAAAAKPAVAKVEQPAAAPARPVARRTAMASRSMRPRRIAYLTEARIIRALHRYGIYW